MESYWARHIEPSGEPGLNYWEYFAERLCQLSSVHNSSEVLDVGTGDGNVLLKAMKRIWASAFGIGVDISPGGLREGVAEAMRQELGEHIAFAQADGRALGFLPETFETVLANFIGWDDCFDFERMDFKCPDMMMSEMVRVLKPGGEVGIGGWVEQGDIDWITGVFRRYFPECDENLTCYSKENTEGQRMILRNGGLEDIRVHVETAVFMLPDAETWWRQMRRATGEYFAQETDPSKLESFTRRVLADLRQFRYAEGIRFSKTVSFAFGIKPI